MAKGETKHERDLVTVLENNGAYVEDLKEIHTVKVKIYHSRKENSRLSMKQEAYRKKCLKSNN